MGKPKPAKNFGRYSTRIQFEIFGVKAIFNSKLGVNLAGARTTQSYIDDSLGKYGDSVVKTTLSGVNGEVEMGGTAIAGLGIRQMVGMVVDSDSKACPTYTTCVLAGPMLGGYVHGGVSGSTGKTTPGSPQARLAMASPKHYVVTN